MEMEQPASTTDPTPISDTATTGDPVDASKTDIKKNPALENAVSPAPIDACDECGAEVPNHQPNCSKFTG